MGQQAKRKKQRQQKQADNATPTQDLHFMEQLQQHGYSAEVPDRAPEIPETRPEPQI